MSTWVLLRGLTREAGHWGDFPALFAAHLDGARIIALDTPGNGQHHQARSPTRIADMVDACRQQLDAMQVPPPYQVLAISLGGMVAAEWARRYPDELRRCVLLNTSFRPFSPFFHRLQPRSYWPLLKGRLMGGRALEAAILQVTSTRQDAHVLPVWLAIRQHHPVSTANALRQLLAAARFAAPAAPPAVPILLLNGAGDRLVSPRCSTAIAATWGVPLRTHPTAGHDLTLDEPQWVAEQVADWMGPR